MPSRVPCADLPAACALRPRRPACPPRPWRACSALPRSRRPPSRRRNSRCSSFSTARPTRPSHPPSSSCTTSWRRATRITTCLQAGEDLLRRRCVWETNRPSVNLEDPATVAKLYRAFLGGAESVPARSRALPASPALKMRLVGLMCRSVAAANAFPLTVQTIFTCLYGEGPPRGSRPRAWSSRCGSSATPPTRSSSKPRRFSSAACSNFWTGTPRRLRRRLRRRLGGEGGAPTAAPEAARARRRPPRRPSRPRASSPSAGSVIRRSGNSPRAARARERHP